MNNGQSVFSRLAEFLWKYEFDKCAVLHKGKSFSSWTQFLAMLFGRLTRRESLQETVTCLQAGILKKQDTTLPKTIQNPRI